MSKEAKCFKLLLDMNDWLLDDIMVHYEINPNDWDADMKIAIEAMLALAED
jgi:hypothetical protein